MPARRPLSHLSFFVLIPLLASVALTSAACGDDDGPEDVAAGADAETRESLATDSVPGVATAMGTGDASLSLDELEAGRQDASWRRFVADRDPQRTEAAGENPERGDGGANRDTGTSDESLDDLGDSEVRPADARTPVRDDAEGPSVLAVQVLLDRALYRPGVMDGRWGKNTEKAVWWMQHAEGLEATGAVDDATLQRLRELADDPERLVVERELTSDDVEGPFVSIPEDIYEKAELDCLCYENVREKLGERFHATPELLERLNPGTDLNALGAGDRLRVPDVTPFDPDGDPGGAAGRAAGGAGSVAEIVVSDGGHYVHALDAAGEIVYHFPSTLGSDYAPSPTEDYEIDSVHQDPQWHYQPDLLTGVDPSEPDAMIPAGPNNAVGVVWMQLTKPHYGIHGTSAPETIGYATSHGCIRLTNWDAELLSHQVEAGVPVRFVDGDRRESVAEETAGDGE